MTKHNKTVEGLRAKYKFLKPFKIKQDAHQIKILDEMLELARNEGREEVITELKIALPEVRGGMMCKCNMDDLSQALIPIDNIILHNNHEE